MEPASCWQIAVVAHDTARCFAWVVGWHAARLPGDWYVARSREGLMISACCDDVVPTLLCCTPLASPSSSSVPNCDVSALGHLMCLLFLTPELVTLSESLAVYRRAEHPRSLSAAMPSRKVPSTVSVMMVRFACSLRHATTSLSSGGVCSSPFGRSRYVSIWCLSPAGHITTFVPKDAVSDVACVRPIVRDCLHPPSGLRQSWGQRGR